MGKHLVPYHDHVIEESRAAPSRPEPAPGPAVPAPTGKLARSTVLLGLAGGLLYWAALPPLGLGPLGWVAPVPWLLLVRGKQLGGRRPYLLLWLCGFVFWLAAIQWLRLPHPATNLAWLALSAYLACYLPAFVGLSRVAVHRGRIPLWLAAPIVWTGLELARAHLLTGFLMASLAHTQIRWTAILQISDLGGQYALDFLMVLVASGIVAVLPRFPSDDLVAPARWLAERFAVVAATVAVLAALIYGHNRLSEFDELKAKAPEDARPRVALIQGNSLADWKADQTKRRRIMSEYITLSHAAVDRAAVDSRPIDLVIWPETMFRTGLLTFDPDIVLPDDVKMNTQELSAIGPADLAALVDQLYAPVMVGIDRVHYLAAASDDTAVHGAPNYRAYNSAVLVNRSGEIVATYDKMHRVLFGEYIPLAKWLPFLYRLTPVTGSIEAGRGPAAFVSDGVRYSPSICYETVLPHVIRRQVATLARQGEEPDVLVNLTNDAWYWGSSELDMHLACGVFRAVECRAPLVIAANGGISASIDGCGRIVAESPRQQPDVILADVVLDRRSSRYLATGDWFAGACLVCCVALAAVGCFGRRKHPAAP